jgi:hypothetical protein
MKPIKAANRAPKGQRITFTHAKAVLHEKGFRHNRSNLGNRSAVRIFFTWLQNRLG